MFLEVVAHPQYFEDSVLNGGSDVCGKMPCIKDSEFNFGEKCWNPIINLEAGIIENWEVGNYAYIAYKICDDGAYFLRNEEGARVLKWNDWYVPESYLSQNEEGRGDYIFMEIEENGHIKDWVNPEFDRSKWVGVDEEITGNKC